LPGLGIGLSVDHVGGYDDRLSSNLRRVDPWTRLNVNMSYRLGAASAAEGTEFVLSGLNVFDASPPFVDREYGFDPANAEPLGRFVSLYVRKNW
jgi:iron complex outermembrane recepter protein